MFYTHVINKQIHIYKYGQSHIIILQVTQGVSYQAFNISHVHCHDSLLFLLQVHLTTRMPFAVCDDIKHNSGCHFHCVIC